MDTSWQLLISNCAIAVLVVSLVICLYLNKKLPKSLKPIKWYLIANLIVELVSRYLFNRGINNLWLLHLFTIIEFNVLSYYFFNLYGWKIRTKHKIYFIIMNVLIILNSIFLQDITGFNSYAKSVVQISIIVLAIGYFIRRTEYQNDERDERRTNNLIVAALLFYYSTSLFIFMFSNLVNDYFGKLPTEFWILNAFLNFVFQSLILKALWKELRVKKSTLL